MSTVSCLAPNKPGDDEDLRYLVPPRQRMRGVAKLLWIIGSLIATINISFNDERTGFIVGVHVKNVVSMLLATLMLTKGLRDKLWPLVIPWVLLSIYQCFTMQYLDVMRIFQILVSEPVGHIAWILWVCYVAVLVLRIQLIITVVFLTLNQWYTKRLINELLTR